MDLICKPFLFQFTYDVTNPLEIGQYLTYPCNTTGHNRRTDNFETEYKIECLENNTFASPSWPTCEPDTFCPEPTSLTLNNLVTPNWTAGDDRSFQAVINWECSDPRYLIKVQGSSDAPDWNITTECLWYENYTINPETFECILVYCYNPDRDPLSNGQKVNQINGLLYNNYTLINQSIEYECENKHKLEQDTDSKKQADDRYAVQCGADGNYIYPNETQQCSKTIQCEDPGLTPEIQRNYTSLDNFAYKSELNYTCQDPRQFIKISNTPDNYAPSISTDCKWRKKYTVNGTLLICKIVRCGHPHIDPGNHTEPPPANDLLLRDHATWFVSFEEDIYYECAAGDFFENDELHPTQHEKKVKCITDLGTYNIPSTWPNCTTTVRCGQPPDVTPESPPWNENGTRTWKNGAPQFQVKILALFNLHFLK